MQIGNSITEANEVNDNADRTTSLRVGLVNSPGATILIWCLVRHNRQLKR
jgi:hypothetical protein